MSSDEGGPDGRVLLDAARELAEIAETVRAASAHATEALTAAARPQGGGLRTQRALLRAVTNRKGLGLALAGGRVGALGARLGGMVGARSLAVAVMTTSLRLRIAAVTLRNPGLAADPAVRRLHEAVAADREIEAARALYALVRDRGAARALTAVAPVLGEVLALRALLDQNPLNDHTAWLIASGRAAATADPLTGLSNRSVAVLDVGAGAARRVPPEPGEDERLRRTGSLLDFLANLCVLGPTGRVLVQSVTGPDGVERHVVLVPGMKIGNPDTDSPGDLLGAFSSTLLDSAPYSRALAKAIDDFGVPAGAEVALIGHSAGGAAIMSLAQDPAFCARRTVTHAVAIGSPIDFKRPVSPRTSVTSITNQHDLVPSLDGQGAGNCFDLHPGWYVADYTDPSHEFPACHSIEHYTANIAHDLPGVRDRVEEDLRPYRGPVTRSQLYRLYDDEADVPRTVPTTRGPVELPVRCADAHAVTAYFTVDAAAAARLLGGPAPARVGGRVVALLHASANRRATLGDHGELTLAIIVAAPPRVRYLTVRALDTLVTTARARAAAREVWGHPAVPGLLHVESGPGLIDVHARDGDATLLRLSGTPGRGVPAPGRDLVVRSDLDGRPIRSRVRRRGRARAHLSPRVRLTAGPPGHPLADHLRDLGLDGARPFLCLLAPSSRTARAALTP